MKVTQQLYRNGQVALSKGDEIDGKNASLVLGFGAKNLLENGNLYADLKEQYPSADIVLSSTSGEIYNDTVYDDTLSVIVIEFERTSLKTVNINIKDAPGSYEAGELLFNQLDSDDLAYVMIISDGGLVNGSQLVKGIEHANTRNIPVSGGLAGDADQFNYTLVGCNAQPERGNITAIGFYGKYLKIGHGSVGGWDIFGPEKQVTASSANRLSEIDNRAALDLYKQYLGTYADELPGSALLFPLFVRENENSAGVVRTILSIEPDQKTMVFAGDIPVGSYIRFMKANFDKLVDAATHAATNTLVPFNVEPDDKPKLALLISCVGRKLILGKRTEEEIEAVKDVFGDNTIISGFYSYGEISPLTPSTRCELHNQTMTITTFNETIL